LYISVFAAFCAATLAAERQAPPDPDALYAQREDLASAREAASIWEARLKENPRDFESTWKLARAYYWLGGHGLQAERRRDLERGVTAGEQAILVDNERPEGYFWKAANMGALAESFGLRQGLKYRGAIKEALLTVLRIDPAYQQGSADRALGRWYSKVPGLFGGSKQKSEEHLRKSLTYNPNSASSLFFLAETLIDLGKTDEAREALRRLEAAPLDPEWAPEDREFKLKGNNLLQRMR
jgi:tetratricopeptide (TPR) repeat protein